MKRSQSPMIFFSFRSPYSWLAYHDITVRRPALLEKARWVPFWEPDPSYEIWLRHNGIEFPYVPMSAAKHRYMLHDVRREARRRNLTLSWPVDESPWWEPSHLMWFTAAAHGVGHRYVADVYKARWTEGKNIHSPDVVDSIIQNINPHLPTVNATLTSDSTVEQAQQALTLIWNRDVFGVPYFLHGRKRFWGMDRLEPFLAELDTPALPGTEPRSAHAPTTPSASAAAPAFEQCHQGGCG